MKGVAGDSRRHGAAEVVKFVVERSDAGSRKLLAAPPCPRRPSGPDVEHGEGLTGLEQAPHGLAKYLVPAEIAIDTHQVRNAVHRLLGRRFIHDFGAYAAHVGLVAEW